MKFIRYRANDTVSCGLLLGEGVVSFGSLGFSFADVEEVIAGGAEALASIAARIEGTKPDRPLSEVALLAPLHRPQKFLAIGLNYKKHIEEAGGLANGVPPHQVWFNKQVTCINGPGGEIDRGVSEKVDYEVELGAVIGKAAKGVSAAKALDHVFGYTIVNDVTARDWQFHAATWTVGKSFDTHGPIGPYIATRDEIPDPQKLNLSCEVNGEVRQHASTADMIHSVAKQIEYLSTAFTLSPGDILATGTPEGVGFAMDPPRYLRPGDVVRCEIDGLGALENKVR